MRFDVAIIGAGPAGSAAAIALGRSGYAVACLDREQFPRDKLCGDFINPINWPVFRALGVEHQILACPHHEVTAFRLTSAAGADVEAPLPTCDGGGGAGLGLSRRDLDDVLVQKAECENALVFQGCRIKHLKRAAQGWEVEFDRDDSRETVGARVLIGADGRNSWVAQRLGLAVPAEMQGCAVGVQLHLHSPVRIGGRVEIHLFPGGYAGLVGIGAEVINLAFAVEKTKLQRYRSVDRLLDSCLSKNPFLKHILGRSERGKAATTYPVYFSPRRCYGDSVLLAGDAARVTEPVTGDGIYFALTSGLIAAETIDAAFRGGDFSATRFRSYERACREAYRLRRGVNAVIRALIYRPALLSPLIRWSAREHRVLDSIVRRVCAPDGSL